MVPRTQNQVRLILSLLEIRRARFGVDGNTRMDPLGPQKNGKRDDHEVVLIRPKTLPIFSITPITRNSSLPMRTDLPMGSRPRKSSRTMVSPIRQTLIFLAASAGVK